MDWRGQLQPDSRQRIVNKISETLLRHLPFSGEGLQEVRNIATRFEEKIFNAATSQTDYLRKISLKMLTMESKSYHSVDPRTEQMNIVEKIEEEMCTAAMKQHDYIRKIDVLKDAINQVINSEHTTNPLAFNSADTNRNLEQ